MRADRLLSILFHLQLHGRLTSKQLAEQLEVSTRTIHRDMESLSAAGVPVYADRGSGGGWSLPEEYRSDLTGLNEAEIQSIFLMGPQRLLTDLGLHKASEAALLKLLATLPTAQRRDAEFVRRRIYIDVPGWNHPDEAVPHLPTIQDAIWHERKLRFIYRRSDDTTVERDADPLGLVAKGRVWYFVAIVGGDIRTYRVSRVDHALILDEACQRPPDFDLATYWEESSVRYKEALPRYPTTVRVDPAILPRMYLAGRFARIEHVGSAEPDGWVQVSIRFEIEADACEYILSFGPSIEVLQPPDLRDKVIARIEQTIAIYDRVAIQ